MKFVINFCMAHAQVATGGDGLHVGAVKVKVKLSLYLNKHHAMKTY